MKRSGRCFTEFIILFIIIIIIGLGILDGSDPGAGDGINKISTIQATVPKLQWRLLICIWWLFLLSEYSQCIDRSSKLYYSIVVLLPPEVETSDGTQRSKSASVCYTIRRHKYCLYRSGRVEERTLGRKRTSQNDPY